MPNTYPDRCRQAIALYGERIADTVGDYRSIRALAKMLDPSDERYAYVMRMLADPEHQREVTRSSKGRTAPGTVISSVDGSARVKDRSQARGRDKPVEHHDIDIIVVDSVAGLHQAALRVPTIVVERGSTDLHVYGHHNMDDQSGLPRLMLSKVAEPHHVKMLYQAIAHKLEVIATRSGAKTVIPAAEAAELDLPRILTVCHGHIQQGTHTKKLPVSLDDALGRLFRSNTVGLLFDLFETYIKIDNNHSPLHLYPTNVASDFKPQWDRGTAKSGFVSVLEAQRYVATGSARNSHTELVVPLSRQAFKAFFVDTDSPELRLTMLSRKYQASTTGEFQVPGDGAEPLSVLGDTDDREGLLFPLIIRPGDIAPKPYTVKQQLNDYLAGKIAFRTSAVRKITDAIDEQWFFKQLASCATEQEQADIRTVLRDNGYKRQLEIFSHAYDPAPNVVEAARRLKASHDLVAELPAILQGLDARARNQLFLHAQKLDISEQLTQILSQPKVASENRLVTPTAIDWIMQTKDFKLLSHLQQARAQGQLTTSVCLPSALSLAVMTKLPVQVAAVRRVNVDMVCPYFNRPILHLATEYYHPPTFRELLKLAPNPALTFQGQTAVDVALRLGHQEIVAALAGAYFDQVNGDLGFGRALLPAIKHKRAEDISLLLQANAKLTETDDNGDTALHLAVADLNFPLFVQLCQLRADFSKANKAGTTPMGQLKLDQNETWRFLSDALQNPHCRAWLAMRDGKTLFAHVVGVDNLPEMLELFVRAGMDVSAELNGQKETALHMAVKLDKLAVCRVLLGAGASLTAVDASGQSPMKRAMENASIEIKSQLLEYAKEKGNISALKSAMVVVTDMIAVAVSPSDFSSDNHWGNVRLQRIITDYYSQVVERLRNEAKDQSQDRRHGADEVAPATDAREELEGLEPVTDVPELTRVELQKKLCEVVTLAAANQDLRERALVAIRRLVAIDGISGCKLIENRVSPLQLAIAANDHEVCALLPIRHLSSKDAAGEIPVEQAVRLNNQPVIDVLEQHALNLDERYSLTLLWHDAVAKRNLERALALAPKGIDFDLQVSMRGQAMTGMARAMASGQAALCLDTLSLMGRVPLTFEQSAAMQKLAIKQHNMDLLQLLVHANLQTAITQMETRKAVGSRTFYLAVYAAKQCRAVYLAHDCDEKLQALDRMLERLIRTHAACQHTHEHAEQRGVLHQELGFVLQREASRVEQLDRSAPDTKAKPAQR